MLRVVPWLPPCTHTCLQAGSALFPCWPLFPWRCTRSRAENQVAAAGWVLLLGFVCIVYHDGGGRGHFRSHPFHLHCTCSLVTSAFSEEYEGVGAAGQTASCRDGVDGWLGGWVEWFRWHMDDVDWWHACRVLCIMVCGVESCNEYVGRLLPHTLQHSLTQPRCACLSRRGRHV